MITCYSVLDVSQILEIYPSYYLTDCHNVRNLFLLKTVQKLLKSAKI